MQAITDCTGKTIKVGAKVRTPDGRVIKVCGGMVMDDTIFNASKCEVVPDDTPTTTEANKLAGEMSDPNKQPYDPKGGHHAAVTQAIEGHHTSAAAEGGTDCIVWGT